MTSRWIDCRPMKGPALGWLNSASKACFRSAVAVPWRRWCWPRVCRQTGVSAPASFGRGRDSCAADRSPDRWTPSASGVSAKVLLGQLGIGESPAPAGEDPGHRHHAGVCRALVRAQSRASTCAGAVLVLAESVRPDGAQPLPCPTTAACHLSPVTWANAGVGDGPRPGHHGGPIKSRAPRPLARCLQRARRHGRP